MWLAELITQRGIGQGMSLLIFANVVAGLPSGGQAVWSEGGPVKFFIILVDLDRAARSSSSSWTTASAASR